MRRHRAEKIEVAPDPRYNNKLISKMINLIMRDGQRATAERIVYDALEAFQKQSGSEDVVTMFHKSVDNVRPHVELKARRVGGATYQIPIEVRHERSLSLALRWLRNAARAKKGKPMANRLAEELMSAFKGEGAAIKKREETHRMAEANRAFAHYRW